MRPSHLTKLLVLFTGLILAVAAFAAVPSTINYQGYLKDSAGVPVSKTVSLRFSLYSTNSGVGPVWQETRSVTPANGVYSVELGSTRGAPLTLPFDRQYLLGVKAGTDPEMRPLQPLTSVPYAFRAGCNPGDMLNCYTGPPETYNVGLCKGGVRTCSPDGSGFGLCVGEFTPNCNGACLDFSNNATNCGSCGTICFAPLHATGTCSGGICGFNCISGYGNCDTDVGNGCETNILTSVTNCGSCGVVCPAQANATATCSSGACDFLCYTGWGNCDTNVVNGCETNLQTSVNNCGSCGAACTPGYFETATCSSGVCEYTCKIGIAECNGICTDISSDPNNCGSCGFECPAGYRCMSGMCFNIP